MAGLSRAVRLIALESQRLHPARAAQRAATALHVGAERRLGVLSGLEGALCQLAAYLEIPAVVRPVETIFFHSLVEFEALSLNAAPGQARRTMQTT